MNTYIEININIPRIEDIRIRLNGCEYSLTPIAANSQQTPQDTRQTLKPYTLALAEELRKHGRLRTAETYRSALNSFLRFLDGDDLPFSQIDSTLICNYERYMKSRGLISNTTSFYLRVLRTIYKRAVADGIIADQNPFRNVYTGICKTIKRAIPQSDIRRMQQLTGLHPYEELARDLFLFSFYTRGMSFIDMAYLRPANISNGILTYRRHKTGQLLSMRWERQMQDIIERHPPHDPNYLLPIIKRSNGHERSQYRECQQLVNQMLKSVGKKAHVSKSLTMYVARHSWASIANAMHTPINIISEAMGHTSINTTQIYIKSLEANQLDTFNARIIRVADH